MNNKPWYASKTLWLNLIGVIIAAFLGPEAGLELDAETTGAAFGAGNILLRFLTSKRIL